MVKCFSIFALVAATGLLVSGCYSCSANGGWERTMNPFCVETSSLAPAARPLEHHLGDRTPQSTNAEEQWAADPGLLKERIEMVESGIAPTERPLELYDSKWPGEATQVYSDLAY